MERYIEALKSILNEKNILLNEPMYKHTSFKTGGNADVFLKPGNKDELVKTLLFFKKENVPFIILGRGTNVLVSDKGIRGFVLSTENYKDISVASNIITASCGTTLSELAQCALKHSLTGLEFASGIPGSVGGGVFMNAGAYAGELKDCILNAEVFDNKKGEVVSFTNEQLDLSYRNSILQRESFVLLEADFVLEKGEYEAIKEKMSELNKKRRDKQPLEYPSAGSTFKRPEGYFAAKLIEDSALKGRSVGDAMVSDKHAGFIINKGNATTSDILSLIEVVKEEVNRKFGIMLETEVRMIGEK